MIAFERQSYKHTCIVEMLSIVQTVEHMFAPAQGKVREIQGQGKVREFCAGSGKFEIFRKVREIQENPLKVRGKSHSNS